MSKSGELSIPEDHHLALPPEIWLAVAEFLGCGDLYRLQKSSNSFKLWMNPLLKEKIEKIITTSFPDIKENTKVSIERLIELPATKEMLLLQTSTEEVFISRIKDGIKNTLALWNLTDSDQCYTQNIKDKALPLLNTQNIDIHGHRTAYKSPLLHAIIERYEPNGRGNSPFAKECVMVIKALLDAGVEINAKDQYGETVLHLVAGFGSNLFETRGWIGSAEPIMDTLLAHGAEVNTHNLDNNTPLHIACGRSRPTSGMNHGMYNIEMLLHHSADPFSQNASGETPWSILWKNLAYHVYPMRDIIMGLDETIYPQQVWDSYEATVYEYYISGGLASDDTILD